MKKSIDRFYTETSHKVLLNIHIEKLGDVYSFTQHYDFIRDIIEGF